MDHNQPGILDIPIEMLEKIFTKLDATDILSCTKVCKQFWNATKNNNIWQQICRRFCDKSAYVIDYVNTVPTTVEPVYSPPQEVQASVCEWRRVYMRLIQLKRNFINGVYKTQIVVDLPLGTNICIRVIQNLLIVYNSQSNEVQVWNVRTEPRLVGTIVCALKNVETDLFMVGDNITFIVQGAVLQWFQINLESGDITHMYRRLVNGNNNSDIPKTGNIDSWYRNRTQPTLEYELSYVTGKYFICVVFLGGQIMLYQWNIETGQKVYESNISCLNFVSLISPVTYSGDILIVITRENTNPSAWYICRYNLESHLIQYLFLVNPKYQPSIHYENNKIVVLEVNRFSNKLTSHNLPPCSVDMPATITFFSKRGINIRNLLMRRNIILYILEQTLIVINNNLNIIYYVPFLRNNVHIVPLCMMYEWNIVLVSFVNIFRRDSVIELHDIIAKSCIKTFDINSIISWRWSCVNIVVQRLAVYGRYVKVLKFW